MPQFVAAMTTGFTGADLANLVNEAALVATRRGANATTLDDFTQALERIVAGLEKKSRILGPHERAVVAHHEIGHALVAMALPGSDKVQKVSIIPRGIAALGYTMQRPTEDRFLLARSELVDRMAVLLGGRAAESLVFGDIDRRRRRSRTGDRHCPQHGRAVRHDFAIWARSPMSPKPAVSSSVKHRCGVRAPMAMRRRKPSTTRSRP